MSDTPFGFGLPPEEPENGDEGKKKDQESGGGQGPANPFGFGVSPEPTAPAPTIRSQPCSVP